MGWTTSCYRQDKTSFVKETTRYYNVEDYTVVGEQVWGILQREGQEDRIVLFLISKDGDGLWGYKVITEEETPFYYDCPLKYLKKVPEPQGSNLNVLNSGKSWRDLVIEAANEKKNNKKKSVKLSEGAKIYLDPDNYSSYHGEYTVVSYLGRKGYIISNPVRGTLRLPCTQAKYVTVMS